MYLVYNSLHLTTISYIFHFIYFKVHIIIKCFFEGNLLATHAISDLDNQPAMNNNRPFFDILSLLSNMHFLY